MPIIVITHPYGSEDYLVEPAALARNTQGLAHVFCLSRNAAFGLSDLMGGKTLSVFDGAVRTFYPGFSLDADPYAHPLVLPQRIQDWVDEDGELGPGAFSSFLAEQVHNFSVNSPKKLEDMPTFTAIKKQRLTKPKNTPNEQAELMGLQVQELESEVSTWRQLAEDRDEQALALQEEVNRLRAYSQLLSYNLEQLRGERQDSEISLPDNYQQLDAWCNEYLSGRLILLNRAVRAVRKAVFEDVGLVYQALLLLAFEYRDLCLAQQDGRQAAKDAFDSKLQAMHLEMSRALSKERVGEFEDQYTVDYTIGQNTRQMLEWHLTKGNDKDERYCLRIYFFWDPELNLVVVGHLPSHLRNRMT